MKTIEDYKNFLAEVRKETGIEALTPDEGGLVTVNVDGKYNLNLQFIEATGKVLCFNGEIVENRPATDEEVKALIKHMTGGCGGCKGCGSEGGC